MNDTDDLGETLSWDEIKDAAYWMFKIWSGEELEWAKECWGHFKAHGLTRNETMFEEALCRLRLVELAEIYQQFCVLAWDEEKGLSYCSLAEDLKIDPLVLGILAGQASSEGWGELESEYEIQDAALSAACGPLRKEMFDCLCKAYGSDIQLYSRMSHTASSSRPEGDEFDVEPGNCRAMDYVTSGFRG